MDSDGAIHIPATPAHRWKLSPEHWRARAAKPFDAASRAFLWDLRWRRRATHPALAATALLLVLLAHGLAFVVLRSSAAAPQSRSAVAASNGDVMQVRLIESPPPLATTPVPQILPPAQVRAPRQPRRPPTTLPQTPVRTQQEPSPMATPTAHLYDNKGRIVLAPAPAPAASVPAYRSRLPQGSPQLTQRRTPLPYTPTKLEKRFVPPAENLLQKAVRKSTVAHTFHLPFGINLACIVSPLALAGGCGPTPPKQLSAPLRVKHKRDNLAPATPLIRTPDPAPASSATMALPSTARSSQ